MISDLIEFGKWLDENNQDDFGKLLKDEDRVIKINIQLENGCLKFTNFKKIITDSINNYDSIHTYHDYKHFNSKGSSLFANQLFFETNQNVMIPSNNAFACLTPFVVSLKRITKKKIGDSKKRNKGDVKKKKEKLEFTRFVSEINNYKKDLIRYYNEYGNRNKINANLSLFQKLFENTEILEIIINEHYNFLYNNYDTIEELKKKISKKDTDIYLYFNLPQEYVLFNDMVYFYCKYLKKRAESVDESKINLQTHNNCQFCGSKDISFVKFSTVGIGFGSYNWNYKTGLSDSKMKICKNCSTYLYLSVQKLIHVFENYFILVPKLRDITNKNQFKMITKELNTYYNELGTKKSKFVLLNKFLSKSEFNLYFNFDFVIFDKTRMGEDIDNINRYVENYKSYLANFNMSLYDGNTLNYLFSEKKNFKDNNTKFNSIFDIESIFKSFFVNISNGKIKNQTFYHFYEIYYRKISGRGSILSDVDVKTVSVFTKYMHNIFNFIYELNGDAINKTILNEIVLNCLIIIQMKHKDPYFDILKRLNYYFMLKTELLGDNMLEEENVNEIKKLGFKYNKKSTLNRISEEDSNMVLKMVEQDPALKYYIIGQFLKYIDNFKRGEGKKSGVFANFVTNANRNNLRNLFVTEILQKNNYYIQKMNKKGKFTFKLFEKDFNSLFDESKGFSFEDYLLLIFTGYYTENLLSSNYGIEK